MISGEDVDAIIAIAQYNIATALTYLRRVNQTALNIRNWLSSFRSSLYSLKIIM
jgi:hypothetical protein